MADRTAPATPGAMIMKRSCSRTVAIGSCKLNYRGSGGRGQVFEESGYRKWGTAMQDDVTDATLWAIEQGLAQRGQICIYGASYGGYSALAGITRETRPLRLRLCFRRRV